MDLAGDRKIEVVSEVACQLGMGGKGNTSKTSFTRKMTPQKDLIYPPNERRSSESSCAHQSFTSLEVLFSRVPSVLLPLWV